MTNSNSYTIKSVDAKFVTVEFVVDGKVVEKEGGEKVFTFDARYLPVSDADALHDFMERQLSGHVAGKRQDVAQEETVALVADEVVGKKKTLSEEDVDALEEVKAKEVEEINKAQAGIVDPVDNDAEVEEEEAKVE